MFAKYARLQLTLISWVMYQELIVGEESKILSYYNLRSNSYNYGMYKNVTGPAKIGYVGT